jgi:diguanylate cyclase (GGDEF)-like protein
MQLILDGLMLLTAAFAYTWYYLLGPAILQQTGHMVNIAFAALLPLCDLVLLYPVILMWLAPTTVELGPLVRLMWLALCISLVGDTVNNVMNTHSFGTLAEVTGPCATLLAGLGVHTLRTARSIAASAPEAPIVRASPRRTLLPYTAVPFMAFLGLQLLGTQVPVLLASGVLAAFRVLVLLILLRQMVVLLENGRLNQLLQERNHALAAANARLSALASTDEQTGLPNYRALVALLDDALARTQRYGHPCTVLFLDFDHFKRINDTWGHPVGDAALQEMAAVLRSTLRAVDSVGRWGGEEFVAVLPNLDAAAGLVAAERLRQAVANYPFAATGGQHQTCSVGVATAPDDGFNQAALLHAADAALYRAKATGRNRVCTAAEQTTQQAS